MRAPSLLSRQSNYGPNELKIFRLRGANSVSVQSDEQSSVEDRKRRFHNIVCRTSTPHTCAIMHTYLFGNGSPKTLRDFGLAAQFESHSNVRGEVQAFERRGIALARARAERALPRIAVDMMARGPRRNQVIDQFPLTRNSRTDVARFLNPRNRLFTIARSRFFRSAQITTRLSDLSRSEVEIRLVMRFRIQDAIEDVLDIFNIFEGNQEVEDGRPFRISHQWEVDTGFVRHRV